MEQGAQLHPEDASGAAGIQQETTFGVLQEDSQSHTSTAGAGASSGVEMEPSPIDGNGARGDEPELHVANANPGGETNLKSSMRKRNTPEMGASAAAGNGAGGDQPEPPEVQTTEEQGKPTPISKRKTTKKKKNKMDEEPVVKSLEDHLAELWTLGFNFQYYQERLGDDADVRAVLSLSRLEDNMRRLIPHHDACWDFGFKGVIYAALHAEVREQQGTIEQEMSSLLSELLHGVGVSRGASGASRELKRI